MDFFDAKILVLPNLFYRFHIVLIKTSVGCVCGGGSKMANWCWNSQQCKEPKIDKITLQVKINPSPYTTPPPKNLFEIDYNPKI